MRLEREKPLDVRLKEIENTSFFCIHLSQGNTDKVLKQARETSALQIEIDGSNPETEKILDFLLKDPKPNFKHLNIRILGNAEDSFIDQLINSLSSVSSFDEDESRLKFIVDNHRLFEGISKAAGNPRIKHFDLAIYKPPIINWYRVGLFAVQVALVAAVAFKYSLSGPKKS